MMILWFYFIFAEFVSRLFSGGWQYSNANESNTASAKEDVKQNYCVEFATKSEHWSLDFYQVQMSKNP